MAIKPSIRSAVETVTGAQPSITVDHSHIHAGIGYTVANKMDIASSKVGGIMISIPAGGYCHFKPASFSCTGGPVYISLLEDYSFTGGSNFPPVNRRRVGTPNVSAIAVSVLADITAIAGASPMSLDMVVLAGTSVNGKLGSSSRAAEEWVLKPGKNYVIAITNATSPGVGITVGYELFWYEEGDA